MQLNFEEKAVRYIMEWGEWIEKLQLLAALNIDVNRAKIYLNKLIKLQKSNGGFARNWKPDNSPGIFETALALELLSKIKFNGEALDKAAKFLIQKQIDDGSWISEEDDWTMRRRVTLTTAKVLKSLIIYGKVKDETIDKALKYLSYTQRDDGLWLRSSTENEIDLEASSEAILALLQLKNDQAIKMAKFGVEALWNWLVERFTSEWLEPPKEALSIAKALIIAGYGETEAVKRILQNYVKAEKWNFSDRRSISTSEAIKIFEILLMSKAIDEEVARKEVEKIISIKEELKKIVNEKEDEVKKYFLIRFEEIGIKPNDKINKILLGCFLYAMLDQFFWASEEFDPLIEYRSIVNLIGDVSKIDNYTNFENVKQAFFKIRALRGIARKRKNQVAKSISLFAKFISKYSEFRNFKDFAEKLRAYTLFEVAQHISGWDSAYNLGLLLRSFSKAEKTINKLVESTKLALECYPAVGSKIASLFLFYAFWIFNLWPEVKQYIKCPIDWNVVKPYGNLGLSCMTLNELRRDPKKASQVIYKLAEELFPNDPAKISFLWIVGHEWCTKPYRCRDFIGRKCWIYNLCRRAG